jgi:hypothetical protein
MSRLLMHLIWTFCAIALAFQIGRDGYWTFRLNLAYSIQQISYPWSPHLGIGGLNQQFVPAAAFFSIPDLFRFEKSVNQLSTAIKMPPLALAMRGFFFELLCNPFKALDLLLRRNWLHQSADRSGACRE